MASGLLGAKPLSKKHFSISIDLSFIHIGLNDNKPAFYFPNED